MLAVKTAVSEARLSSRAHALLYGLGGFPVFLGKAGGKNLLTCVGICMHNCSHRHHRNSWYSS